MNDLVFDFGHPRASGNRLHIAGGTHYWAFLSYSHTDRKWAAWLHRGLETYRVPKDLVGGSVPERLAPIFRDRDELQASDDLGAGIRAALSRSRFLIVLCSPAAAASRWTNEEVTEFKRLHPDRPVLAAIVAGEPFASESSGREGEECFPPALRRRFDPRGRITDIRAEPIAADLREQGDGKRIGKLKLIAGMLGVGLDQLARRESQRRHRRLTLVTAASIAGMAVTSALAVAAFEARDEARDQREEAEELVGFMLGDLRQKLEPLGRLDVMDSVGAKALAYYENQNKGDLSEESLAQRSRALTLIGEIANLRGDLDAALRRFREASASTAEALSRAPEDEQRIFDHAQNVYWVGYTAWQRGKTQEAWEALGTYKQLAGRLVRLNPSKPEWQLESIYADTNLGLLLLEQQQLEQAAGTFELALREAERLAATAPDNRQYRIILSEALAYLADAQESQGRFEEAIGSRERQLQGLAQRGRAEQEDAESKRSSMAAERAMGRLLLAIGEPDLALQRLSTAATIADDLRRQEPNNTEWLQFGALTHLEHGTLLLLANKVPEANRSIRAGCEIARLLMARDPSVVLWTDAYRSCLVARAESSAAQRRPIQAIALAEEAIALPLPKTSPEKQVDSRFARARALRLAGDQYVALGSHDSAQSAWGAALAELPSATSQAPRVQAMRFGILRRLNSRAEADVLAQRLDAIGYRHPTFLSDKTA